MNIDIIEVDYLNKLHAKDLGLVFSKYAKDPMGGNFDLNKDIIKNLAENLSKLGYAFSILSYVENKVAGFVNCFEMFSTFKCKPVINIHDVFVDNKYRGLKLSHLMLNKVEDIAIKRNCCKLTLEVLEKNEIAKNSYLKLGFKGYELDPKLGKALFWEKEIKS